MNKDIQQKLFNYFQQEHGIMLLDGDYNEIEHILKSELSSVLTDEEIEAVAQKRFPHKSIEHQKVLFIGGAKFARGIIEPSILTDKEIKEEADKLFIIPYKEKEKGFGHITTKRECWVRGAKFFRGTVVSVLTNEEIKTAAAKYAIERHGLGEEWQPDREESGLGFIEGVAFARGTVASLEDMINLLREVYQRMLIDIDENGEPKSGIKELIIMWEKVDKYLVESKQTDVLQQVKPEIKERRNYERKC